MGFVEVFALVGLFIALLVADLTMQLDKDYSMDNWFKGERIGRKLNWQIKRCGSHIVFKAKDGLGYVWVFVHYDGKMSFYETWGEDGNMKRLGVYELSVGDLMYILDESARYFGWKVNLKGVENDKVDNSG
jgi:hypothetical protein